MQQVEAACGVDEPIPRPDWDSMFSLAGKSYVVTGAASGIGRAMAAALLAQGAGVLLVDLDDARLQALIVSMADHAARGRAVAAVADIGDIDAIRRVVQDFAAAHNGIDGLFANAGISGGPGFGTEAGRQSGLLEQQSMAQWQSFIGVNLQGTAHCMQAALPALKARRAGRIVVTASVAGLRAEAFCSYAYVVAKAAVVRLVQQAALELAPHAITVNAIAPGFIRTAIGGGRLHDQNVAASLSSRIPLGRLGEPEDVAGLAVFLASPASAYITGAVIPVDGGYLLD